MPVTENGELDWPAIRDSLLVDRTGASVPPRVKLPVLPASLTEVLERARDPEVCVADIVPIVERDSGITAQLLRYVNASSRGTARSAKTAGQAIVRLGVRNTCLFLTTEGVKSALRDCNSSLIDVQSFWCGNLARALLARRIASEIDADPDIAFAAAMIADSLLPVLTGELSDLYDGYPESRCTSLVEYEQDNLGWDHSLATALAFDDWGFPEELVCAVRLHHKGAELLDHPIFGGTALAAVGLASFAPDRLQQERRGVDFLVSACEQRLHVDPVEIAETVDEQFRQFSPTVANPLPLTEAIARRGGHSICYAI